MMKKRLSKTLWYGSDIDKEGKPVLPPLAEEANDLEGIHEGELYLHIEDGLALLFTRSADGQVVQLGSNADELANYLLKSVWDKAFEFRTTENGEEYLFTKLNLATQYGITMYANGGLLDLPKIFDGLPIDNDTIYWDGDVLKSRSVGEGGVTPTLLGDLKNVGSWANAIATEDRIMVQKKDSSSWEALELSKIGGSASFENVKESGEGNAFTSFVLSEDKKTLTFVKDKTFAEKSSTLSGYGITDAYTKTEADNLLAKKWTQDDNKITNWDTAFGWGDHSKVGYAKAADVTGELKKYVTLSGTQTITGEKNFTGGLKVNGQPIVYNSDGYWLLDGDLIVTGGVTMFANENGYTPSTITDAVSVDNITIIRQDGKLMVNPELVFGGGGGEVSTVAWGNVLGKPTWITDTKPEYKYSEIKETPNLDEYAKKGTTLSAYGITDANINNGVITLGSNTITPLTQVLGDARYVTALGTSGNDLTWTKNGLINKITVPYATHSAHTSYLRNYLGDYNSITDLDAPSTIGDGQYRVVYDYYNRNASNKPVTQNNANGALTFFKGIHVTGGGQYMSQLAFPDKDAVYFRRASDGVFGDWKLIAFTDSDITGNAGTATALKDRRSLWGQWFDGKDNVSGDMTGVGSVTMDGQLSLNGITIKKSADGVLFVDGNLVVSGGITMYGTDGTTAPLIWDDAPIANANGKKGVASYDPNFFAVNNGVVTFVGQTGGGTDIDLSEYAKKATTLSGYGITDAYTKNEVDNNFVAKTTKDFMKVNGSLTSNVDFNDYYTPGSYNNTTGNGSGNSNAPAAYGLMLVFGDKSGYAAQLHVNSGNTSVKVRTRYMSGGSFSWKEWKELAYTTSNVASATKLETPRKIWGQNFDGTENVSGAITGATTGSFSGNVSMGSATINGGKLTYDSTNKYWKLEGDLLVTGGVTMFGNDSSFSPSTITQAVNVDGTTIINDGKKLMLNPDIQLGGGVTDYNDLTNKPDLSVYALKTSLSSYQTKITSTNKLDYGLISGTPTIPTNTNQLTNGAGFITSSGSITGNAATATTASKLSTVSKSAWGKTYWTSGGVPTDINGDMSSVGNITSLANGTYDIGSSSNKWKDLWVGNVKYTDTMYIGFSSSYASIRVGGSGSQLVVDDTSVRTNSTASARASLGTSSVPWAGLYSTDGYFSGNVGIGVTTAEYKLHVNGDIGNANVRLKYSTSNPLLALIRTTSSESWYVQAISGYLAIGGSSASACKIDASGNFLSPAGITMYGSSDERLKRNIRTFKASEELMSLGGVFKFEYTDEEVERNGIYKGTHIGLIYQNVKDTSLAKMCYEREDGYGALNYLDTSFISLLAGVGVEHETRIRRLERENIELKKELEYVKRTMEAN